MFAKRSRHQAQAMARVTQAIDWLEEQDYTQDVSSDVKKKLDIVTTEGVGPLSARSCAELHFMLLRSIFQKSVRMYPRSLLAGLFQEVRDQGFPSEEGVVCDLDSFDPDVHAVCVCMPSYLDALGSGQVGRDSHVVRFPHATFAWWGGS